MNAFVLILFCGAGHMPLPTSSHLPQHVTYVIAICSVGSLKPAIGVGSLVVCDDYWCPSDIRRVYSDARAHLMPGFSAPVRAALLEVTRAAGFHPLAHGVYANARGPRFETKSEIRMMADYCDVVGMTAAHEATACAEVGLPYAALAMVDNYAHGIGTPGTAALTVAEFHAAQAANMVVVESCVGALLAALPARGASVLGAAAVKDDDAPHPANATTHVDLLVHARYVVPVAPGSESAVLEHAAIAVAGGRIVEILPSREATAKYAATRVVHLDKHHVVMPGLVNSHTHLALNLLKGVADDMPLAQWLTEQIWPIEARVVSPDFVRVGTAAAVAECIRSGVTTINDMYWFPATSAGASSMQ